MPLAAMTARWARLARAVAVATSASLTEGSPFVLLGGRYLAGPDRAGSIRRGAACGAASPEISNRRCSHQLAQTCPGSCLRAGEGRPCEIEGVSEDRVESVHLLACSLFLVTRQVENLLQRAGLRCPLWADALIFSPVLPMLFAGAPQHPLGHLFEEQFLVDLQGEFPHCYDVVRGDGCSSGPETPNDLWHASRPPGAGDRAEHVRNGVEVRLPGLLPVANPLLSDSTLTGRREGMRELRHDLLRRAPAAWVGADTDVLGPSPKRPTGLSIGDHAVVQAPREENHRDHGPVWHARQGRPEFGAVQLVEQSSLFRRENPAIATSLSRLPKERRGEEPHFHIVHDESRAGRGPDFAYVGHQVVGCARRPVVSRVRHGLELTPGSVCQSRTSEVGEAHSEDSAAQFVQAESR